MCREVTGYPSSSTRRDPVASLGDNTVWTALSECLKRRGGFSNFCVMGVATPFCFSAARSPFSTLSPAILLAFWGVPSGNFLHASSRAGTNRALSIVQSRCLNRIDARAVGYLQSADGTISHEFRKAQQV